MNGEHSRPLGEIGGGGGLIQKYREMEYTEASRKEGGGNSHKSSFVHSKFVSMEEVVGEAAVLQD